MVGPSAIAGCTRKASAGGASAAAAKAVRKQENAISREGFICLGKIPSQFNLANYHQLYIVWHESLAGGCDIQPLLKVNHF